MRVFISWSGSTSGKIGEAIKDWLPAVLQNVKPYFTPSDIEKGSRWTSDISQELEESRLGLFIYTPENLESQWMLFEAGAISKTLDNSKVCPILFGIDATDFKGPLTQFQSCQFSKSDFRKLVKSINNSLAEGKLEDKVFEDVFEMWWPKLETKIANILKENKVEETDIRKDRELLEEILSLSRLASKTLQNQKEYDGKLEYDGKKLEHLVDHFLYATELIFKIDWVHTKGCLSDGILNGFVSESGDFLDPHVFDESSDWANRAVFLDSYRQLAKFMDDSKLRIF